MQERAAQSDVSVLVTRPAGQGEELCRRLRESGVDAVHLPSLLVGPVPPSPALSAALAAVPAADWTVFVSRNAVSYGMTLLEEQGLDFAPHARLAAIGSGTARALRERGIAVHCRPEHGFTSEALLASSCFTAGRGDRVLIFRGQGGRPLLADALRDRGARVRYVEVYRREMPQLDVRAALDRWRNGRRRWVVVTSGEGLGNLMNMVGDSADELRRAGLVTVSERVATAARRQGWKGPVIRADQPDDAGLFAAISTVLAESGRS